MNIYVGNLAKSVTETELEALFTEFGAVKSVKVIRDLFSGESKGFGFVEMPGLTEAKKAIDDLNGRDVSGRNVVVNEARPKPEGGRGGSRGGGGQRNSGGGFRGGNGGGGGRRW